VDLDAVAQRNNLIALPFHNLGYARRESESKKTHPTAEAVESCYLYIEESRLFNY
jgi:hypothetical protein